MSSQSLKSGKAISPFLSDWVTYTVQVVQSGLGLHNFLSMVIQAYTCVIQGNPGYTWATHVLSKLHMCYSGFTWIIIRVIWYIWATHVLSIWLSEIIRLHMVIKSDPGLSGYTWYPGLSRLYTYRIYTHVLCRLHMVIASLHVHGYNKLHGYLGYKWLFMFTSGHPGHTWLQTILN